jgi:hypothetical protein
MESANVQDLHDEWQSAVQAHAILCREGRMHGLTSDEIEAIGYAYVLRIDAAYARLKQAEEQLTPPAPRTTCETRQVPQAAGWLR